jgi:signal peptidase II
VLAIVFIVSIYGKLSPTQWALKWGLPLVLGGALGNLADRVTRIGVVDFIDYRADWVAAMNRGIAYVSKAIGLHDNWTVTDHWPTFNVADIAICIGVGLMALDMFLSKRESLEAPPGEDLAPPRQASSPTDATESSPAGQGAAPLPIRAGLAVEGASDPV